MITSITNMRITELMDRNRQWLEAEDIRNRRWLEIGKIRNSLMAGGDGGEEAGRIARLAAG